MINKIKNLRNKEEGFTLIELLVVVGIISVIAAITIPMVNNQIYEAEVASVKEDVRRAADAIDISFTVENGYPTTLGNIVPSPKNILNLYGGGNTGIVDNGIGVGVGSSGTTKPSTNRELTWEEFNQANLFNTNQPYQNFSLSPSTIDWAEGTGIYTFAYTAETFSSLSSVKQNLTQACSYVEGKTNPVLTTGMGKNNCYALTTNTNVSDAEQDIIVVSNASARNTPSNIIGTDIASYSWNTDGYYVVAISANPKSNDIFDGAATTDTDITIFYVSTSNTVMSDTAPNIFCIANSTQGATFTEHTINSSTFCGSLAIMSDEVANSFWQTNEVPEIPANLTPANAGSGSIIGYCVEGHNTEMGENEGWYHITAETNKLTEGRCPIN